MKYEAKDMAYRISSFRLLMSFTSLGRVAKSACSEVICGRSTSILFLTAAVPYGGVSVNKDRKQGVVGEPGNQHMR